MDSTFQGPHTETELFALLRLQAIPHIGDQTAKKLIAALGSAEAIFKARKSELLRLGGIGSRMLQGLFHTQYQSAAAKELKYIRDKQIQWVSFRSPAYPKYLKHCRDGPILLFSRGTFDLRGRKIISVVGTRNSTGYGQAFCDALVEDLLPLAPVIVSGFAYGIDIQIHKAAIRHGLPTLAVLAHGLNQLYPREHSPFAKPVERNGGFITEFWSSSKPNRENFLRRNRIIAGISEATVVVESANRGGALITADMAHGYNRDVFAVPGRVGDYWSQGCNQLIKVQKAHMLSSAADLVYILGWELPAPKNKPAQKELFIDLNGEEQRIYSFLEARGKQLLDDIALNCDLSVSQTATLLFSMEMKGCIRPLPGKCYEIA